MTTEKWVPKVGDAVAIVYWNNPPLRGEVTRKLKRHVDVTTKTKAGDAVRRFRIGEIEPWSEKHSAARARAIAIGRLRKAADDAFATGEGLDSIAALPTARLDEAAAFLRALVEEAKAAKQ